MLAQLEVPDDEWQGTPVEEKYLDDFMPQRIEGNGNLAGVMMQALFPLKEMHRLEWQGKVKPPIRPDMDSEEIDEQLGDASDNAIVSAFGGAVAAAGGVRARPNPQQY